VSLTKQGKLRSRVHQIEIWCTGVPNIIVPGQEWRRAGLCNPALATELDQTKLYGFVVYSWNDVVLSVQRIRTRTRTR
jgi:hypothetical protein